MGPLCEISREPLAFGAAETRPRDGLIPKRPQQAAGIRTEPPPSDPCASGSTPAATAAAAPPDEPPGVREVSHGFRHAPFRSDSVTAVTPNSGVLLLPITTKPEFGITAVTESELNGA